MSHATLLVIGNGDLDDRMAPYYEQTKDPEFREFMLQIPYEEAEANKVATLNDPNNKEYTKDYKKNISTEEFMRRWHGYEYKEDEGWGFWYNPLAKWDWWVIGGRWRGQFILKEGRKGVLGESGVFDNPPAELGGVDQALACDIDWDKMNNCSKSEIEKQKETWKNLIEGKDELQFYKPEYYLERYKTEDNFVKAMTSFNTFAVLDEDNIWHEAGRMGMFAVVDCKPSDELDFEQHYFERFIEPIMATNTLLTLIDYHI